MDDSEHGSVVSLRELTVETRRGPRKVLVARPTRRSSLDRKRLEALRAGDFSSRLNDAIFDELARRTGGEKVPYDAILFEAGAGQGKRWGFAEDISEEEIVEFGELMIRSQLRMFEQVAERGVAVLAGVEFGERELIAYDRGARRLASRLEQTVAEHAERGVDPHDNEDVARARLHLWLLDHFAIWSDASADEFIEQRLPETLVSSERIRRKLSRMLG